ncbi:MAG: DNA lyase [Chloroflexi bacterium]|nr:DNA lyase [Chloroflexota bacterium]
MLGRDLTKMKFDKSPNYHKVKNLLYMQYGDLKWRDEMETLDELIFTVLTQNTSDINAEKAFKNLKSRYINWDEIAKSTDEKLERIIRIGGLGKQKSIRIKKILKEIYLRTGGYNLSILKDMTFNEVKEWLITLPGVGPKTAAVVMSFALKLPAFPVDTHIHRISKRLGYINKNTSAEKAHEIMEKIILPEDRFDFHILLITHGRKICKANNPKCSICPLTSYCPSVAI